MINYFYNIILKTDLCDLYSDVLTGIRKDYYLSKEKQKGKITQNSSGNSIYYEFAIEKDRAMRWNVSNSKSILSDCKTLDDNQSCVSFYDENGKYKSMVFSRYQTLLKVEYFNMLKTSEPYCVIEPRKAGNGLCLLLTSRENVRPSVLYPMPAIDDDYVHDKIELEFTDYTVIASTNEGVVKFLSETQLELFEDFVDRATAMKLTETAPVSFIEEDDAVLAQKLNPKDFNIKRNLSEIVDISKAQEFSYDNIEEELVSGLLVDEFEVDDNSDLVEERAFEEKTDNVEVATTEEVTADTDAFIEPTVEPVEVIQSVVETYDSIENEDTIEPEYTAETKEKDIIEPETEVSVDVNGHVAEVSAVEEVVEPIEELAEEIPLAVDFDITETVDDFVLGENIAPDRVIESSSAKYMYYGELNDNGERDGFGRTATEDGRTAYEGAYSDNKRDGVGAYYYKDSSLCYYGEWKNNKREGFGVGVSSLDRSVHVGKFADNKPVGDGVRVSDDGNIKFVKKVLSNGVTVELKFDGDKIFVSKYDENGELISENTSNLMYF